MAEAAALSTINAVRSGEIELSTSLNYSQNSMAFYEG